MNQVKIVVRPFMGNVKIPSKDVVASDNILSVDKKENKTWVERKWWKVFAVSSITTKSGNGVPVGTAAKLFTKYEAAKDHAVAFAYHVNADHIEYSEE